MVSQHDAAHSQLSAALCCCVRFSQPLLLLLTYALLTAAVHSRVQLPLTKSHSTLVRTTEIAAPSDYVGFMHRASRCRHYLEHATLIT